MLQTRRRIGVAADEWQGQDRNPDLLYRGTQLAGALEWLDEHPHELTPVARDFLDEARRGAGRRSSSRGRGEARGRRNRRLAVTALAALAVAAIAASVFAFVALGRSQENERGGPGPAGGRPWPQRRPGARPTIRCWPPPWPWRASPRADPPTAAARNALVEARIGLDQTRARPQRFGNPVPVGDMLSVAITPDGDRFITGGRGRRHHLLGPGEPRRAASVRRRAQPGRDQPRDLGRRSLGCCRSAVARPCCGIWRPNSRRPLALHEIPADDEPIWAGSFSPDSSQVALGHRGRGVAWCSTGPDAGSWPRPPPLPVGGGNCSIWLSVRFVDDDLIVAGNGNGEVHLIDRAGDPVGPGTVDAHGGDDIWELVLGPDSGLVYSVSTDNTVRAWRIDDGPAGGLALTESLDPGAISDPNGLVVIGDGLIVGDGDGGLHRLDAALQPIDDGASAGPRRPHHLGRRRRLGPVGRDPGRRPSGSRCGGGSGRWRR